MRIFPGKSIYYISDNLYQIIRALIEDTQVSYPLQIVDVGTWSRLSSIKEGRPEVITYLKDGEIGLWPIPDKKYMSRIYYLEQPKVI